jgi:hypothetical protein
VADVFVEKLSKASISFKNWIALGKRREYNSIAEPQNRLPERMY